MLMRKLPYLKYYRYVLFNLKEELVLVMLGLASALLGLAVPLISKLVIDRAYSQNDFRLFFILFLIGGFIILLNESLNYLINYLTQKVNLRIRNVLSAESFAKCIRLPYSFFQENPSSASVFNLQFDVEQVSQFVSQAVPQFILIFLRAVFIMAAIFYLDWKIAAAFLLVSPLALFLPVYFNKKIEVKDRKWVESSQGIFLRLQETFSNIKLLKLFDTYDQHTQERIFDLRKSFDTFLDKLRLELRLHIAGLTLNKLFSGIFVLYCGYGLFAKSLSLGTLSAILLYLGQIFQIHNSFLGFLYGLPQFLVSSKRLEHITNVQFEAKPGIINPGVKAKGWNIGFDKVSFKYKDRGLLFSKVSFVIESGSLVGLVGLSGCGKTTIINLMLGVLSPEEGRVCIDGVNIVDLDQAFLRKHTAVAPQEIFLWDSSIASNISYGLGGDLPLAKIKGAAKIACIDDFIESLEKGYDTIIGEDACRLSEGQKQKIALARAVIREPRILFLDEATAHLDAKNESDVFENLRKALPRATIIFVSHNRALLEKSDKICFVHSKNLIEVGSHNELLARYKDYVIAIGLAF